MLDNGFGTSERNTAILTFPCSTSEAFNGHSCNIPIQEIFKGMSEKNDRNLPSEDSQDDGTVTLLASVTSSKENFDNCNNGDTWTEGEVVYAGTSRGFEQEQNDGPLEGVASKIDWNIFQHEFLEDEADESGEQSLTEDDGKDDSFQTMDETFETGSFGEICSYDTDCKTEYSSTSGSDANDNNGYSSEMASLRSVKVESKRSSNQGWLFQNSEHEIAFGGNDWGEYLHEHKGEIDGSTELWVKDQDRDHGQVDFQNGMVEESLELAELEEPDEDYLSGDSAQVRGTGRPDLDDVEDDVGIAEVEDDIRIAEERFIPQFQESAFLESCQNSGSGRPDLEEDDMFSNDRVFEDSKLGDMKNPYGVTPGTNRMPFRENLDGFLLELCGQVDLHAQDELRHAFAGRLSEQPDGIVALDRETVEEEGSESDVSQLLDCNSSSKTQVVEPLGKMRTMMQDLVLEDKKAQVGIASTPNSIPKSNFQDLTKFDHLQNDEQEDHLQADTVPEHVKDGSRKRGCVIRLGSKEAEELLRMDVANVGRAVFIPAEAGPKESNGQERIGVDWAAEDLGPDELSRYVETLEVQETYIDTVLDMEDILFDAEEASGARIIQTGKTMSPRVVRPVRDGSLSASTSHDPASSSRQLRQLASTVTEVDWVEVVGALQRRGGASFGERVVGVKEHTVYRINVQGGGDEWEVYRRYRDFVLLHNQLQKLFTHRGGVHLPSPWEKVKSESRKFFGNTSPDVVEVRSALIQVCLHSLLQAGPPLSTAAPLLQFLLPDGRRSPAMTTGLETSGKHVGEGQSGLKVLSEDFVAFQQYSPKNNALSSRTEEEHDNGGQSSVFGKTIRLIVQIHKKKSLKQQLQAQHFTCAGCYKHLELALGLVPELVQNWGWRGPRLCEYSGQLFCSTCHLNETAVIPAWVLQRWDFAPRQVSQLAKAYLDSIYDKPMLCVSAVNPYLYARVPVLAHLTEIRRKLSKMLAYIRCPARARIQAMLGSRRYLLENNDFFALRDLADLSKGAFAVLPGYMRELLTKLSIHITSECSACRDLGEACSAGELCDDPFDVIFPYQDENITRCQSCHLPYHKRCFHRCQKSCFCSRRQPVQMLGDSQYSGDVFYSQLETESSPRTIFLPSVALEREDLTSSSSVAVNENKVKAKKSLLANLLGSKEAQSESQREKRHSVVLNMSALLSPLEL